MRERLLFLFRYFAMLGIVMIARAADDLDYLREVDFPHPHCEAQVDLDVGREYFVEIENDLPGREAYNEVVRLYRHKEWEQFDTKWAVFRKAYETSPLQEAAAFIWVQSKFERATVRDEGAIKECERLLRETLLLYPQSTIAPILAATVAGTWQRSGWHERALSLYETARDQYKNHPLACVFLYGAGESQYLLRDLKGSTERFFSVLKDCKNDRLRVAADLRLGDIEFIQEKLPEPVYDAVYSNHSQLVTRSFPSTLFNLGELKYRRKQYSSARFFFKEYLEAAGTENVCSPYARKRLADIAFQTQEPLTAVRGLYLLAKDRHPTHDVGRFAQIQALLLGMKQVGNGEYERRLKLIDEQIDQIQDLPLKSHAFLEKGLVLLDRGEKSALDYLVRLNERRRFSLDKGPIAAFVRDRLLRLLEAEGRNVASKRKIKDEANIHRKRDIYEGIEQAHALWLKGTPFEDRGRELYGKVILRRFSDAKKEGEIEIALTTLVRWKNSPLWPQKGPDAATRASIGADLLESLQGSKDLAAASVLYLKNEDAIRPFIDKELPLVWLPVALGVGDPGLMKRTLKQWSGIPPKVRYAKLSPSQRSYAHLVEGQAYRELQELKESEKALLQVVDPSAKQQAMPLLVEIYETQKNYRKAFETGLETAKKVDSVESKKDWLGRLVTVAYLGKLWNRAPAVRKLASEWKFEGKDLAPAVYLSAHSDFELNHCKSAIPQFELALTLDPTSKEQAGSRYRLGKCFHKQKQPGQAKQVWDELIKGKDPFWAPMVQNEMKLLK